MIDGTVLTFLAYAVLHFRLFYMDNFYKNIWLNFSDFFKTMKFFRMGPNWLVFDQQIFWAWKRTISRSFHDSVPNKIRYNRQEVFKLWRTMFRIRFGSNRFLRRRCVSFSVPPLLCVPSIIWKLQLRCNHKCQDSLITHSPSHMETW